MRKITFLTHLLLFFCLSLALAQSADAQVRMRHYGIAQGLSNEQTRHIVQMADDRILVEVEGSLSLFDGQGFQTLEYTRQQTLPVESFLNTDHWTDAQGRLWLKETHRLIVLDAHTYAFLHPYELLKGSGVELPLKNFFIDSSGQAWLHAADNGLYRYDWQHAAHLVMPVTQENNDGTAATVCDVVQVDQLHYVMLSNDELMCYDSRQNKLMWTQPLGQPWGGFRLKGLAWDEHTLLIRTREQLIAFDVKTRSVRTVLQDNTIFEFRRYDDELWVSCRRKLYRLDESLKVVETIDTVTDEATGETLNSDFQGVCVDHQGGLWVCTFSQGVMYQSPARRLVRFTPADGRDVYDMVLTARYPHVQLPAGTAVTDIASDKNGRVWVATRNRGILIYGAGGQSSAYTSDNVDDIWGTIAFVAPDDRLFACHLNRLGVLHPERHGMDNLSEQYPELLSFRNMVACCPARGGWLIGTQNGFFFYDTKTQKPDLQHFAVLNDNPWSDKCNCLMLDSKGIIWIGTQNGLLRYDEVEASVVRYDTSDGLPNNCVQSVVEDAQHNLWVATIGGLVRLNIDGCLQVGYDDGLRDMTFLERAASVDAEGVLRFGTRNGVYSLRPADVKLPQLKLVPQLMAVHVRDSLLLAVNASSSDWLRLSYNENYLTFDISALNYAYSHHTVYRYRLVGLGEDWQTVIGSGEKLQVHYTSLPTGNYTLEVEAAMQGQPWGPRLSLPLRIAPPWWQSWWALTLYVLLAVALVVYLMYSWLERQRNILAIERQETRIRQLLDQIRMRSLLSEKVKAERQTVIKISQQDEQFLHQAMDCVERHLDDSDYSVEDFARDMAMERTTLYRRIQTVVSQSPTEFMRTVRLKRASELLRSGRYNVSEVSDMTGFSNRKSFSKFFRDAFGVLPSQYDLKGDDAPSAETPTEETSSDKATADV